MSIPAKFHQVGPKANIQLLKGRAMHPIFIQSLCYLVIQLFLQSLTLFDNLVTDCGCLNCGQGNLQNNNRPRGKVSEEEVTSFDQAWRMFASTKEQIWYHFRWSRHSLFLLASMSYVNNPVTQNTPMSVSNPRDSCPCHEEDTEEEKETSDAYLHVDDRWTTGLGRNAAICSYTLDS